MRLHITVPGGWHDFYDLGEYDYGGYGEWRADARHEDGNEGE